jgi:hypothetical protein
MKSIGPFKSLFGISVFLAGSCSIPLQVSSNYDHYINFLQYRTFGICALDENSRSVSNLDYGLIINAVKSEMAEKGFDESKIPDLWVNVVVVLIDKKTDGNGPEYYGHGSIIRPYGFGTGTASGTITPSLMTYKDGSLIIDEIDAKTGSLIWEGIGNSEFDKPLKNPEKKIQAIVKSVMACFPPYLN